MKELWTGRVELLTPATEFGDTKCFTNVFVWAEGSHDFAVTVARHLEAESISVLQIEECHRVADDEEFPEERGLFSIGQGPIRVNAPRVIGTTSLQSPHRKLEARS